jgi:hypothetical protein
MRFGPVNARKQHHNSGPRDLVTGKRISDGKVPERFHTPVSRGYWAFPFPFHDAFFYSHVYRRDLPKKFRDNIEWSEDTLKEYQEKIRASVKRNKAKYIWHDGRFYSRIKPSYDLTDRPWYLYNNSREWVDAARKHLWCWNRWGSEQVWKCNYSKDHLELFIPG